MLYAMGFVSFADVIDSRFLIISDLNIDWCKNVQYENDSEGGLKWCLEIFKFQIIPQVQTHPKQEKLIHPSLEITGDIWNTRHSGILWDDTAW